MKALEDIVWQTLRRGVGKSRPRRCRRPRCVAPGRKIDPGAKFDWRRLAVGGLWRLAGPAAWRRQSRGADPERFRGGDRTFGYPRR